MRIRDLLLLLVLLRHIFKRRFRRSAKENPQRFDATGEYWVVGVDIEQYDKERPDKYIHGEWLQKMSLSIEAYHNYFSIVASAPIDSTHFTRLVNEYRHKPPFNFTNPSARIGGMVQVTSRDHGVRTTNFCTNLFCSTKLFHIVLAIITLHTHITTTKRVICWHSKSVCYHMDSKAIC